MFIQMYVYIGIQIDNMSSDLQLLKKKLCTQFDKIVQKISVNSILKILKTLT